MKISEMPLASSLTGAERLPLVQSGANRAVLMSLLLGATGSHSVEASRYGVDPSATGSTNYTGIMNAIDALPNDIGTVILPPGTLALASSSGTLPLRSNLTYVSPGRLTELVTDGGKIFEDVDGNTPINDAALIGIRMRTTSSMSSSANALVYVDGPNVDGLLIDSCILDCGTATIDAIFAKAPAGRAVRNIAITRNKIVRCLRIGIEVINHDNATYNSGMIVVEDNETYQTTLMAISLSGLLDGGSISRNRMTGFGPGVGAEVISSRGIGVNENIFTGTFNRLIQTASPGSIEAANLSFLGNRTAGRCGGSVYLAWAGSPAIDNNVLQITGTFTLAGANTHHAKLGPGNHIDTTATVALLFDGSPHNRGFGGIYSTAAGASNASVIRANGSGAVNNVMTGPTMLTGSGGVTYGGVSSGELVVFDGYGGYGSELNPTMDPVGPGRMHGVKKILGLRGYTGAAGSTSAITITFPTSGSWLPSVVKISVALSRTDSGANGYAERHLFVRSTTNSNPVVMNNTAVVADTGCTISTSTTSNVLTVTVTAASSAVAVYVAWNVEVSTANLGNQPFINLVN